MSATAFENIEKDIESVFSRLRIYDVHRDLAVFHLLLELQEYGGELFAEAQRSYRSGGSTLTTDLTSGERAIWHLFPQLFLRCPKGSIERSRDEEVARHALDAFEFGMRYQLFYDLFFGAHREWDTKVTGQTVTFGEAEPGRLRWRSIALREQREASFAWEAEGAPGRLGEIETRREYSFQEYESVSRVLMDWALERNARWARKVGGNEGEALSRMEITLLGDWFMPRRRCKNGLWTR
jgi:hypothetical protein